MNTFLKVLLVALVACLIIKISPLLFVAALAGVIVAAVLGALGVSLLAVLCGILLGLVIALSPIWIPVLVVIGLVSLFRENKPAVAAVPPMLPPGMPTA